MYRESKAFIAGYLSASTVSIENCYYLNTQAYRAIAGISAADMDLARVSTATINAAPILTDAGISLALSCPHISLHI